MKVLKPVALDGNWRVRLCPSVDDPFEKESKMKNVISNVETRTGLGILYINNRNE